MNQRIQELYDEVPYLGQPFFQTRIQHLATMATIYGMTPPSLENCKVLELGCTDGGNLIPMALCFPQSQFLGIDLSPKQIMLGKKIVEETGISNLQLKVSDILEVDDSWGKFDFILVHGVYSWVPEEVQNQIFEICQKNLSTNGLAYISYNIYPGWKVFGGF